ncbi:protein kinase [Cyanobacteria bacterium FACHB-63]|nr:protein kinase [Cyanobacteria bacterium FACHB-63]
MTTLPSDPWLDRSIGENQRYQLVQRLGGGSMGDVFVAIDTKLGQQVALKILKSNWAETDELRRRFEHEVALCAALRGDHIVQVSDYGVTPEGYPFYVMEYLRGQTLGQLMRREGHLPVDRAIKLIIQVCDGLEPAHQGVMLHHRSERIRVVHRDLKPENIYLVNTALGELVKILDFGIAKIQYEQSDSTVQTGMFIGTFHYASPEQVEVRQEIDGRSDIYSLGVILYEMLAGADPFGLGRESADISQMSWAIAHASRTPIPLCTQANCEAFPAALEGIVMRCLQKHPDQRFATIGELRQVLCSLAPHVQDSIKETRPQAAIAVPPVAPTEVSAQTASAAPVAPKRAEVNPPQTEVNAPRVVKSAPKRASGIKLILLGFGGAIALSAAAYWGITQRTASKPEPAKPAETKPTSAALLKTATDQANAGKLTDAIATATQIPVSDAEYAEAQTLINQWSQKLIASAEQEFRKTNAQTALKSALTKLQAIPKSSAVYSEAQTKQQQWQSEWNTAAQQIKQAKQAEALNQWNAVFAATNTVPSIAYWQQQAKSLNQKAEAAQKASTPQPEPPVVIDTPRYTAPEPPVDVQPPARSTEPAPSAPAYQPSQPNTPPAEPNTPSEPKAPVIPPREGKF